MTDAAEPGALSPVMLDAVAAALTDVGIVLEGPLTASLISGGRSNHTYLLAAGTARWVMRTPPRKGRTPSAHDVAREYRVTDALRTSEVPVAAPVVLRDHDEAFGVPFAVAEFVPGRTLSTRRDLAALDEAALRATVDRLVATLAALHRVDHLAVGLEGFGRVDHYAERQLRRWSGQWDLVGPEPLRPLAAELVSRLAHETPPQRAVGIVHGDFRIDNTILDLTRAGEPRIAAVVDWELSTIGDPVADVAMMCAYRDSAFDLILGEESAWASDRLPGIEDLAARYEAHGGLPLRDWSFHLALACFKVAAIAAGIDHRLRAGATSAEGYATAGQATEPYLQLGLRTIAKAVR